MGEFSVSSYMTLSLFNLKILSGPIGNPSLRFRPLENAGVARGLLVSHKKKPTLPLETQLGRPSSFGWFCDSLGRSAGATCNHWCVCVCAVVNWGLMLAGCRNVFWIERREFLSRALVAGRRRLSHRATWPLRLSPTAAASFSPPLPTPPRT